MEDYPRTMRELERRVAVCPLGKEMGNKWGQIYFLAKQGWRAMLVVCLEAHSKSRK